MYLSLPKKEISLSNLKPYINNSRTHTPSQIDKIVDSIKEFGFLNPIIVDGQNGIIAGHARVLAAEKLGYNTVPCVEAAHLSEDQKKAYVIADNRLALDAGWDDTILISELTSLKAAEFDIKLTGFDNDELSKFGIFENNYGSQNHSGALLEKFLQAPFTIFDTRKGWWIERKRAWKEKGLESDYGRGDKDAESNKSFGKTYQAISAQKGLSETSIFDPVLCELLYSWFSAPGGIVLDPFCGGSVRGIVASLLGRDYFGIDLREGQIEANELQVESVCKDGHPKPCYKQGDSRDIITLYKGEKADFLFSCPPYHDLEVYSDDAKDLSTLSYEDFIESYRHIIKESATLLKDDRFACFVVTEIRDKKGFYKGFVKDTIQAFEEAGLRFYNDAILVNTVGDLGLRVGRSFNVSRKLGRMHQNILLFVKGDPKKATQHCGEIKDIFIPEDDISE